MNDKAKHELLQELTQEDMTETVRRVCEIIGKEKLLELCYYVDGTKVYIPPPDTLLKKARNRKIQKEYNGYNTKELAKKYDLTKDYMNKLIRQLKLEQEQ